MSEARGVRNEAVSHSDCRCARPLRLCWVPFPPPQAPHICRRVGTDASSARSISLLQSVQQRLSKALTTTRYRCMFEWQDGCLHCSALLTRKLFSAQYLKYGPEIIRYHAACHCSQRTSTCSSELFLYSSPICV